MCHLGAPMGFEKSPVGHVLGPVSNQFCEIRTNAGPTSRKQKGNSHLVSLNSSGINQDSLDQL